VRGRWLELAKNSGKSRANPAGAGFETSSRPSGPTDDSRLIAFPRRPAQAVSGEAERPGCFSSRGGRLPECYLYSTDGSGAMDSVTGRLGSCRQCRYPTLSSIQSQVMVASLLSGATAADTGPECNTGGAATSVCGQRLAAQWTHLQAPRRLSGAKHLTKSNSTKWLFLLLIFLLLICRTTRRLGELVAQPSADDADSIPAAATFPNQGFSHQHFGSHIAAGLIG